MTYEEFIKSFYEKQKEFPNTWRTGQALFNYLYEVNETCAEKLRGTENDPFYFDYKIGKALEFIKQNW